MHPHVSAEPLRNPYGYIATHYYSTRRQHICTALRTVPISFFVVVVVFTLPSPSEAALAPSRKHVLITSRLFPMPSKKCVAVAGSRRATRRLVNLSRLYAPAHFLGQQRESSAIVPAYVRASPRST